jgi:hypothetical protein
MLPVTGNRSNCSVYGGKARRWLTFLESSRKKSAFFCAVGLGFFVQMVDAGSAELPIAHIINEDSHPHSVKVGETAHFSIEASADVARVDVKCSLEGDEGMPLSAVTLRSYGLSNVAWPFPTLTIRVEQKIDFDVTALTQTGVDGMPYFEFVNEDRTRIMWHQCYNN